MNLELARNQKILDVAREMGLTLKKRGSVYQDEQFHVTIYPSTNSYFNFYEHRGGSPIDFLIKEMEMTFREASDWLLSFSGEPKERQEVMVVNCPKCFSLPPMAEDNSRVFLYLTRKRGLDEDLVEEIIRRGFLYEEKQHHNCVFVGMDYDGKAKHAFLHGTDPEQTFKGDAVNSDKRYGFTFVREGSDTLTLFEAPIDLLSYVTLEGDFPTHLMALGMLSSAPADLFLVEHPEIRKIRLLLDRDVWGKAASERLCAEYKDRGYDIKDSELGSLIEKAGVKDVNEYLLQKGKTYDVSRR